MIQMIPICRFQSYPVAFLVEDLNVQYQFEFELNLS